MAVIKVETFDVDVPSGGTTHTLTNDVGSLTKAFVKINSATHAPSAGPTTSTANAQPDEGTVDAELTATDTITFARAAGATLTVKVIGEVWRFVEGAGDLSEFVVRNSGSPLRIACSGTSATAAIPADVVDRNRVIPILAGAICNDASESNWEAAPLGVYLNGTNVVVDRNNSGTTSTACVYIVEFTGSNWSVGHGISTNHDASTATITLNTDSSGTGGSTFDVGSWSNAMLFGTMGGDSTETGLADVMAVIYPAGTTTQVNISVTDADANARNDANAYIHALVHSSMDVFREVNTNVSEGNGTYGNVAWPTGAPTNRALEDLSLEWFVSTSGTGTAHMRGALNARITAATGTIQHWIHRSGNNVLARYGVVDFTNITAQAPDQDVNMDVEALPITEQDPTAFNSDFQQSDAPAGANIPISTLIPTFIEENPNLNTIIFGEPPNIPLTTQGVEAEAFAGPESEIPAAHIDLIPKFIPWSTAAPLEQYISDHSPTHWWKLDETTGLVYADSVGTEDLDLVAPTTQNSGTAPPGSSLSQVYLGVHNDGSNVWPTKASSGSFGGTYWSGGWTWLFFWTNVTTNATVSHDMYVYLTGSSAANYVELEDDGDVYYVPWGSSTTWDTNLTEDGIWHVTGFRHDDGVATCQPFTDTQIESTLATSFVGPATNIAIDLINTGSTGETLYCNAAIFDKALTDQEIEELMLAARGQAGYSGENTWLLTDSRPNLDFNTHAPDFVTEPITPNVINLGAESIGIGLEGVTAKSGLGFYPTIFTDRILATGPRAWYRFDNAGTSHPNYMRENDPNLVLDTALGAIRTSHSGLSGIEGVGGTGNHWTDGSLCLGHPSNLGSARIRIAGKGQDFLNNSRSVNMIATYSPNLYYTFLYIGDPAAEAGGTDQGNRVQFVLAGQHQYHLDVGNVRTSVNTNGTDRAVWTDTVHMHTITSDGTTLRWYVNGLLLTSSLISNLSTPLSVADDLWIGTQQWVFSNNQAYDFAVSNVCHYEKELNTTEIADLWEDFVSSQVADTPYWRQVLNDTSVHEFFALQTCGVYPHRKQVCDVVYRNASGGLGVLGATYPHPSLGYGGMGGGGMGEPQSSTHNNDWATGDFTVEYWANARGVTGSFYEVKVWASNFGASWEIGYNESTDQFYYSGTAGGGVSWSNPITKIAYRRDPHHHAIIRSGSTLSLYLDGALVGSATHGSYSYTSSDNTQIGDSENFFGGLVWYTEAKNQTWCQERTALPFNNDAGYINPEHPIIQSMDHFWMFHPNWVDGADVTDHISGLTGTLHGSPTVTVDGGMVTNGVDQYFSVPLELENKYWSIIIAFRQVEGTEYNDLDTNDWFSWQEPTDDTNIVMKGPDNNTGDRHYFYIDNNEFLSSRMQLQHTYRLGGDDTNDAEHNYFHLGGFIYTDEYQSADYGLTLDNNFNPSVRSKTYDNSGNPGKVLKLGYQDNTATTGYKKCQILFIGVKNTGAIPFNQMARNIASSANLPDLRFILAPQQSDIPAASLDITTYDPEWSVVEDTAVLVDSSEPIPTTTQALTATVADNPNDVVYVPLASLPIATAGVPTVDAFTDVWATHLSKYHHSSRISISFLSPKSALLQQGGAPGLVELFDVHGTDINDPWEDDAQMAGSFIPQDSMETINFKGRWFSMVNKGVDFKWSTSNENGIHYSLSGSFWFLPLTNGGAAISDPKVDGECIFRVDYDDLSGEFLGMYWNDSKLTMQFQDTATNDQFVTSTLAVGQYHHVAWYHFWGGSTGDSMSKIVIDGKHVLDIELGSFYVGVWDDSAESCNVYVGAKNLAGDNKFNGYLSYLEFNDPDEYSDPGQDPIGAPNTLPVSLWWHGAVLNYADQNEWWGRPWKMNSLTGNGAVYFPCDDATFPPVDLGGDTGIACTKKTGVSDPTMQVASYGAAPGCMSLQGEQMEIDFDIGQVSDTDSSRWATNINEADFPTRYYILSFWFRYEQDGTLPTSIRLVNLNYRRISTDSDNARVFVDPTNETIRVLYGAFDVGSTEACKPNTWHYLSLVNRTNGTSNQFTWTLDGSTGVGGTGLFNLEGFDFRVYNWEMANHFSSNYVKLDLAHIQWNTSFAPTAYEDRDNLGSYYGQTSKDDLVIEGPSYNKLAGVTTEYRDNSFWLQNNYFSCQYVGDQDWQNEGTNQALDLRATPTGTLGYTVPNGVVKGLPYVVQLSNSHQGNAIRFWYDGSPLGAAPTFWVKFTAWTTASQTTIASGFSIANDGVGLPWAEWFFEREAGTNRVRTRLTTISGRGFHYPMELTTAWVDVGLDEWNFIAIGEYTCNNCSPPSDSKIEMSINGTLYASNVWPSVFNTNYKPEEWTFGSTTTVTDGFSAEFNCFFLPYNWDNTTHIVPAYLDGKPDTALVQAMGSDSYNFISRVNHTGTTLDYVVRPGTPSVFSYQPNTTGVTGAFEAGPVGSFDLASRMTSTPKWIEVSDPSWNSAAFNVNILECAFKTSGHSSTGTFKMLCSNKNINGVYALGLLHDNTTDTVKLFWTDENDVEYTSGTSVSWPQDQYNHVIINRAADISNDRADLYLNGTLAISVTNIQTGLTPEYGGVFGGAYYGCVSGTVPATTYISHTGFKMSEGWGITELFKMGQHWQAYQDGDQSSGDQGEDNQCDLGRSDDHNHLPLWPRPLTVTEEPPEGTILPTASLPINGLNPTWETSENHQSELPAADLFINTWNPIWVATDPQDSDLPAASLPIGTLNPEWVVTEFNYVEMVASSVSISTIGNTWFNSDFQQSNIPTPNIPIDLLDPTADTTERNFIRMKTSDLPIDTEFQRFVVTEDNWSDLSTPNLPLVANGITASATEARISNTPTAQLDVTPRNPEAFRTILRWVNIDTPNIPINTQEIEATPSRSTDRREVIRFESELAISPEMKLGVAQRVEMSPGPVIQRWILQLAQSTSMTSNLATQVDIVQQAKEDIVRFKTDMSQAIDFNYDVATAIKQTAQVSQTLQFTMNVQQKQEITSPAGKGAIMEL